jgi:hypothetical protein
MVNVFSCCCGCNKNGVNDVIHSGNVKKNAIFAEVIFCLKERKLFSRFHNRNFSFNLNIQIV